MPDSWNFPNRATPVGSAAYYSVRFSPPKLRHALAALHAWRGETRAVIKDCSDPGVARLKLQWWQEEIGRCHEGSPKHPLTQTLEPLIREHELPLQPFLELTQAVEWDLRQITPGTRAELDGRLEQDLGALFELIGRCHGQDRPEQITRLRDYGRRCAGIYLIRNYGAITRLGHHPLPADLMSNTGNSGEPAGLRSLAGEFTELPDIHPMPAAIAVHGAILKALLVELEDSGFDVSKQRIGLTPLRKLWIGWRTSRKKCHCPLCNGQQKTHG